MKGLARKVGDITQVGVDTGDATAQEADVLEGTTVYLADGAKHEGTMVDMTVDNEHAGVPSLSSGNLRIRIPVIGKYGLNNYITASYARIRNLIGLTAEMLVYGKNVLGLTGTGTTVIYLGTGMNFDVSSIEGYENFTDDNFIVCHANATVANAYRDDEEDNGLDISGRTISVSHSYNASTGVLTIRQPSAEIIAVSHAAGGGEFNRNSTTFYMAAPKVYLATKVDQLN